MANKISRTKLRRLRNDVDIIEIITEVLDIPHKISEGYLRFLCPACSEFNSAVYPSTNLAHCFLCRQNYNPIDLVMMVRGYPFREAVEFLLPLLPPS